MSQRKDSEDSDPRRARPLSPPLCENRGILDIQPLPHAELPAALAAGATIVTATNRLARELLREHDAARASGGATAWERPDVLPWSAWLRRAYVELIDAGLEQRSLLTPAQQRALWEEVVAGSPLGDRLLRPRPAAALAGEAWELVQDWELPAAELQGGGDDTLAFLDWAKAFEQRCRRERRLPAAHLPAVVAARLAAGDLPPPARLILAGFDEHPPARRRTLEAIAGAGGTLHELQVPGVPSRAARVELADPDAEVETAVRWAAALVAADPSARVALVDPNLAGRRSVLLRVLEQVFYPGGAPDGPRVFDLSLGVPLAEIPPIRDALALLDLLGRPADLNRIGGLLRSPFLAGADTEWPERARLDAWLRELAPERLGLDQLLRLARRAAPAGDRHCPMLVAALERLHAEQQSLPRRQAPGGWARALPRLLEVAGWPGPGPLDSTGFQQVRRWHELFAELASLEAVQPAWDLRQAVRALRTLAEEATFQPEGGAAAVRVLGPLEAGGLRFDALWVLGLDDRAWPPTATPNPLLPAGVQRRRGLPHASADRELAYARQLTVRLLAAAPQVLVSHARRVEDTDRAASALVRDLPVVDASTLPLLDVVDPLAQPAAGETVAADDQATALPAGYPARGGVWVLADQSACPFRAFATHRLHAEPLAEPLPGLDAAARGSLVHRALESAWQELGGKAQLDALDEEGTAAVAGRAAAVAVADLAARRPEPLPAALRPLETARLTRLVAAWLAVERGRATPFRVLSEEERRSVEVGGLRLDTRVDRVDELPDGRRVVIDYKTGRGGTLSGWFAERLAEPQLPLYATTAGGEVAAALIAKVRADEQRFLGVAATDEVAPGVSAFAGEPGIAGWPDLLAHWRQALDALATEFRSGRAAVAPSDPGRTCEHCPLPALCRIGRDPCAEPAGDA